MSRAFADAASPARAGWSAAQVALFDAGFARYWERSASLARRTTGWPPPRRRHVAIVRDPLGRPAVRLAAQHERVAALRSATSIRRAPIRSSLAYLLAHGDWMAQTGEVAFAAVRGAAWWLERTDDECAAFAAAARAQHAAGCRGVARAGGRACRGCAGSVTRRSGRRSW